MLIYVSLEVHVDVTLSREAELHPAHDQGGAGRCLLEQSCPTPHQCPVGLTPWLQHCSPAQLIMTSGGVEEVWTGVECQEWPAPAETALHTSRVCPDSIRSVMWVWEDVSTTSSSSLSSSSWFLIVVLNVNKSEKACHGSCYWFFKTTI